MVISVECQYNIPNPHYQRAKRVIDVVAAILLLMLFAPLLLLICLLIRIDSRGPIIYTQQRIGKNGGRFTIFKFRSMQIDAPCISTEEMQRIGYNPITKMGKLLRKTSLDELPQLVNILKGEMSFIGPRPALSSQHDVNSLREELGVHSVLPGLSGLAQVMGRDDLDTNTKVNYDAEYCRTMHFWLDVKIVGMTISAIILSRGNK
jgi:lipopolysaccharide/colanic/teichoic acid biosynthesis glycosyltransferase